VAPNAATGSSTVTVMNGLRLANLSGGFHITPALPGQSMLRGPVVDPATGRAEIASGGTAQVRVAGPLADVPNLVVMVGDRPATGVVNSGGLLSFRLPLGLNPGVAIVQVSAGNEAALPVAMAIDVPPPVVNFASISGAVVDTLRPARPGELVTVNVSGLAEVGAAVASARVIVVVGEIRHTAVQVTPVNGSHNVQFVLDSSITAGPQLLTVSIDGRVSSQFSFLVRPN
jgi:hypothetical protein